MALEKLYTLEDFEIKQDEKFALAQLFDFVDWFAPNKEVNEKLTNNIINISLRLKEYEKQLQLKEEGWVKLGESNGKEESHNED